MQELRITSRVCGIETTDLNHTRAYHGTVTEFGLLILLLQPGIAILSPISLFLRITSRSNLNTNQPAY